jgi:hypothetical protein
VTCAAAVLVQILVDYSLAMRRTLEERPEVYMPVQPLCAALRALSAGQYEPACAQHGSQPPVRCRCSSHHRVAAIQPPAGGAGHEVMLHQQRWLGPWTKALAMEITLLRSLWKGLVCNSSFGVTRRRHGGTLRCTQRAGHRSSWMWSHERWQRAALSNEEHQ